MMGSLALSLYLAASSLAGAVAPAVLVRRRARGKEDPARLGERLGHPGAARPEGKLIWMHGASVGEAMSMLPLITALQARRTYEILVTTGTVTSARRLADLLPPGARHQYVPVDTAGAVRRFLDHWKPDLAIWIESELWPRLVVETARRGIQMAMVNARISEKSARGWARVPAMARALLGSFRQILTQDTETAARLRDLGIDARFAGNVKALVEMPEPEADELAAFRSALADRPVWLAASTHEGEEARVVAFHEQICADTDALLILAPRHPERADAVAAEVRDKGFKLARRSQGDDLGADTQVYLADTLGEMGLWYRLAPVTFVGGSLVPVGGHTPFEPISCGSVVVHGPHVDNFAPAYAALNEACVALDATEGASWLQKLLADPEAQATLRKRAAAVHENLKPDVGTIADDLLALMEPVR